MDVQKFQTYPVEVPLFRAQPVRMLAAGDFHTLALTTAEGAVYGYVEMQSEAYNNRTVDCPFTAISALLTAPSLQRLHC